MRKPNREGPQRKAETAMGSYLDDIEERPSYK
jgi:hypothetical protein